MLLTEISFPAWQQYLSWTPLCRQHPHRHRRPQRLQNCCPGDRTKNEYNYYPRQNLPDIYTVSQPFNSQVTCLSLLIYVTCFLLILRYVIITISCIIMIFKILPIQGGPLTQLDPLDTLTMRNHYHIIHNINFIIMRNSVNPGRTIYPT